ncbi:hypothetical protein [Dactylosporangium sp. NPDC005555]|uniref:hypothetical protein n=1 Tax=Dactylosporangium sp. NPDC005555 TaxID=3154889 RepID=UPI0033A96E42
MSNLSAAEEQQIIAMLRAMGTNQRRTVLASVDNFLSWLRGAAQYLWASIRNAVRSIWDSIVGFFS